MNLHVNMISGRNPHHVIEAAFKALTSGGGSVIDERNADLKRTSEMRHRLLQNRARLLAVDWKLHDDSPERERPPSLEIPSRQCDR
jgi:hypothetical protein